MPSLSVVQTRPSMRRNDAPADSSPPNPNAAVDEAGHEPLEADRDLHEPAADLRGHLVDHRRGHEGLADGRPLGPAATGSAEEVADRDGQEVVGVHQPRVRRDDPVAVRVGVVAGGDVVLVALVDERGHGRRGGAVHPDLAVPVQGHEPPGRVDERVDHGQVEVVAVGDLTPVGDAGPTQRVGADPHAGLADAWQVDDVREVVDVRPEEVVRLRVRAGPAVRHTAHALEAGGDELVRAAGDDLGGVRVGRPAVGRVVLEPAVRGRVVRRRDDDAVGQALGGAAVERLARVGAQDRVRDAPGSACSRRGRRRAR